MVNMESVTMPRFQQHGFIDSSINVTSLHSGVNGSGEAHTITRTVIAVKSLTSFLMCVFGIPGNLLVVGVYAYNTSTSTKVYMFALAVADLDICVTGIILTRIALDFVGIEIITFIVHTSVIFSSLLLAFVALERLLAVRRPHSFSLCKQRAKRALVVIAVMAVLSSVVLTVGRVRKNILLIGVFPAVLVLGIVLVMIVCYSLMSVTMVLNVRAAHTKVDVVRPGPSPIPTVALYLTHGTPTANVRTDINMASGRKMSTVAKRNNAYKGVSLLFTITVVFVITWTPQWLSEVGFHIPGDLQRLFLLNSVVNPFIYSAVSAMFREDVRRFCQQMRSRLAMYRHY